MLASAMITSSNVAGLSATHNIFDTGSLADLKRQIKAGDPAANKAVAKQFEGLFLQLVLKSMRAATPREGLFGGDQMQLYESLLDQQLGTAMAGGNRGTGLAAMIEAQLARQNLPPPKPFDRPLPLHRSIPEFPLPQPRALPLQQSAAEKPPSGQKTSTGSATAVSPAPTFPTSASTAAQQAFVDRLLPAAITAESRTGIPAHFMVAQAALETGWGRSVPRLTNGGSSFNIFGIKAGGTWSGPTVAATTTEVIGGKAQARVESFRAYASYEAAFQDYAKILTTSPRYASVLGSQEPSSFGRSLQAAGYATDPQYASKLERIIGNSVFQQVATA